ncbi:uncharacterized protein BDR25DRAFT_361985 [Lindgomyces ingoldianus]|uniref:Uncharacterized protein n=1 Tax=Lindgomyces ingoldianus TaxID=673940 RepID=A0ACB6QAW8_9PLEO|nr:uncharacterized protein BDR25DRAFT_361985 [Lindgomyces ingoldianus]KAF2464056.1 hypothetical protein BDR25DRAFT_361985 [Lindgomyces ingoldianus]
MGVVALIAWIEGEEEEGRTPGRKDLTGGVSPSTACGPGEPDSELSFPKFRQIQVHSPLQSLSLHHGTEETGNWKRKSLKRGNPRAKSPNPLVATHRKRFHKLKNVTNQQQNQNSSNNSPLFRLPAEICSQIFSTRWVQYPSPGLPAAMALAQNPYYSLNRAYVLPCFLGIETLNTSLLKLHAETATLFSSCNLFGFYSRVDTNAWLEKCIPADTKAATKMVARFHWVKTKRECSNACVLAAFFFDNGNMRERVMGEKEGLEVSMEDEAE